MKERCHKLCFDTRKLAKTYIKKINRIAKMENKLTEPYYCSICSCWHVTSMPKGRARNYKKYLNGQRKFF